LRQSFTPRKRVKFEGGEDSDSEDSFVTIEVPTAVKFLLKPGLTKSDDIPFALTEDFWNAVCAYLAMLDKKLPELELPKPNWPRQRE
jgi:hypothetical protein